MSPSFMEVCPPYTEITLLFAKIFFNLFDNSTQTSLLGNANATFSPQFKAYCIKAKLISVLPLPHILIPSIKITS